MKKLTFITVLLVNAIYYTTNAQPFVGPAPNWVSPDHLGIGLPVTLLPDAKLKIVSGYVQTGGTVLTPNPLPATPCYITGEPALSIYWPQLDNLNTSNNNQIVTTCSNVVTPPNIFEVYANKQQGNSMSSPIVKAQMLAVDAYGNTTIGNHANIGKSMIVGGYTHLKKKLRVGSVTSFADADWNNFNFPYTFSVDNGNSRFLGNMEIGAITAPRILTLNGDLIITGNNTNTNGDNEIRLSSDGYIRAREIKVDYDAIPDYVFKSDYNLMPLLEIEEFINKEHHLPNIKAETEFNKIDGISLGELNIKLLEKIEELTLYSIRLQKQANDLQNQINSLKAQN